MKIKTFLRPDILLLFNIIIYQVSILGLALGFVKTFRLELESYSVLGGVLRDFLIFFLVFVIFCCVVRSKEHRDLKVKDNPRKIYVAILVMSLVCGSVSFYLFYLIFSKYGFNFLHRAITGALRYDKEITEAFPFRAFSILPLVSVLLCALYSQRKKCLSLFVLNILLAVFYCTIFTARIFIIQCAIFVAAAVLRFRYFEKKIKLFPVLVAGTILAVMLVVTAAYRDYEAAGFKYTESPIMWGIATINDYFLSCSIYSSNFMKYNRNSGEKIEVCFPWVKRFKANDQSKSNDEKEEFMMKYGDSTYNNLSSWTLIWQYGIGLAFLVLFIHVLFFIVTWQKYSSGHLLGYLFYPISIYALFEFWRIPYLLEELTQILILVLFCVYKFIRTDVYYQSDNCL